MPIPMHAVSKRTFRLLTLPRSVDRIPYVCVYNCKVVFCRVYRLKFGCLPRNQKVPMGHSQVLVPPDFEEIRSRPENTLPKLTVFGRFLTQAVAGGSGRGREAESRRHIFFRGQLAVIDISCSRKPQNNTYLTADTRVLYTTFLICSLAVGHGIFFRVKVIMTFHHVT